MPGSTATLKNRFVTVQLTLLSIAVALILESLLGTLLNQSEWSTLIVFQATEVAVSAISMWVGFATGSALLTSHRT